MSDIVEFLLARVAEDEADARAADGSRWFHQDKLVSFEALGPDGDWVDVSAPISVDTRANGHHIARWSPARVLAECEAKRRIIALHEEWPVLIQTEPTIEEASDLGNFAYRASQQIAWATNREYVARFGTEAPTTRVLLALALPYAQHPSFDPRWAV